MELRRKLVLFTDEHMKLQELVFQQTRVCFPLWNKYHLLCNTCRYQRPPCYWFDSSAQLEVTDTVNNSLHSPTSILSINNDNKVGVIHDYVGLLMSFLPQLTKCRTFWEREGRIIVSVADQQCEYFICPVTIYFYSVFMVVYVSERYLWL